MVTVRLGPGGPGLGVVRTCHTEAITQAGTVTVPVMSPLQGHVLSLSADRLYQAVNAKPLPQPVLKRTRTRIASRGRKSVRFFPGHPRRRYPGSGVDAFPPRSARRSQRLRRYHASPTLLPTRAGRPGPPPGLRRQPRTDRTPSHASPTLRGSCACRPLSSPLAPLQSRAGDASLPPAAGRVRSGVPPWATIARRHRSTGVSALLCHLTAFASLQPLRCERFAPSAPPCRLAAVASSAAAATSLRALRAICAPLSVLPILLSVLQRVACLLNRPGLTPPLLTPACSLTTCRRIRTRTDFSIHQSAVSIRLPRAVRARRSERHGPGGPGLHRAGWIVQLRV
jgi:hypothetical protein